MQVLRIIWDLWKPRIYIQRSGGEMNRPSQSRYGMPPEICPGLLVWASLPAAALSAPICSSIVAGHAGGAAADAASSSSFGSIRNQERLYTTRARIARVVLREGRILLRVWCLRGRGMVVFQIFAIPACALCCSLVGALEEVEQHSLRIG